MRKALLMVIAVLFVMVGSQVLAQEGGENNPLVGADASDIADWLGELDLGVQQEVDDLWDPNTESLDLPVDLPATFWLGGQELVVEEWIPVEEGFAVAIYGDYFALFYQGDWTAKSDGWYSSDLGPLDTDQPVVGFADETLAVFVFYTGETIYSSVLFEENGTTQTPLCQPLTIEDIAAYNPSMRAIGDSEGVVYRINKSNVWERVQVTASDFTEENGWLAVAPG